MEQNSNLGTIYNLQRYCLHDGPGIRSIVFFKGCPLRCRWCSNPESQSAVKELFYDRTECLLCGRCVSVCSSGALEKSSCAGSVSHDADKCLYCFTCVGACSTKSLAIKGYQVDVKTIVDELVKDKVFFDESGGGVTLSGGEPLAQPDFAAALLSKLKAVGINTCMETSAYASLEALEKVIRYADLIFCDIKHADDQKHREFTGTGVEGIFANLKHMLSVGCNVIVRIPVIPGFNHDPDSMRAIAARLAGLGVKKADLLPFHQFGKAKYGSLFREYGMSEVLQLKDEGIACHRDIFASYGIDLMKSI